ncbi:MAG TPA: dienelactone hydrolase family protein [Ktedonobacterales bacterium]|nr:dienelactone hydrolase family protein [Ktedonobacterales bacterium]
MTQTGSRSEGPDASGAFDSPTPPPIALTISTPRGPVHGLWRPSSHKHTAVLLLPGRDDSLSGPADLYTQLAPALQRVAAVIQLGYHRAGSLDSSRANILGALEALSRQGIERVALIGWDFGGAVAIVAGARSPLVTGVACLAPDPCASDDIAAISPRRLLLAHGSADAVIPQSASILLHTQAGYPSELALYPHETHDFIRYRAAILKRLILWTSTLLRTPFKPGRVAGPSPVPTLAAIR